MERERREFNQFFESKKFNYHSYKDEGMLYPSGEKQEMLLREFYSDLKLDPRMVSFMEAHGTGTKVPKKTYRF